MPKFTLELARPSGMSDTRLFLELDDTPLAKAVVAALRQPDLEALQVIWSGNGFSIALGDGLTIPDMKGAEVASEFERGAVAVYAEENKLIVAYDHVETYEGDNALECYPIGRVAEPDLDGLKSVGDSIHRDGVRVVKVV